MLLAALIASAPLPDPGSAESVGWLILTIAGTALALDRILSLWRGMRSIQAPDPAVPSTDRVKALEDRIRTVEIQMATHMGSIDSKFSALTQTLTNLQSDWNYALGKIDGRSESTDR
jgi:hypothetical protein